MFTKEVMIIVILLIILILESTGFFYYAYKLGKKVKSNTTTSIQNRDFTIKNSKKIKRNRREIKIHTHPEEDK